MQGKFRVILQNGFDIITTMIVQNTTFITNFVPIERFDVWKFPFGDEQKKKLLKRVAGNSAGLFHSYPSNWVRHYHSKDCAKYHFLQLPLFELSDFIPARFSLERQEKNFVEARSRDQCRAISEVSFELGSSLSLQ